MKIIDACFTDLEKVSNGGNSYRLRFPLKNP